jgi:nucleotide-binding universal stress UspA family protein
MAAFHRILIAVDGSEPSEAAVALALKIAAEGTTPELSFCHVVDTTADYSEAADAQSVGGGEELIDADKAAGAKFVEAAQGSARTAGLGAAGEVLEGPVAETIVRRAQAGGFDLIVCGTHGRRGIQRMFLGSTAEAILRRSSVPVLTVK